MLDRLVKEKQKLDYFLWLVQIQWKGSVKDYAMKLGVSEATFYRRIATLTQCGIPLYYDKVIGCYCLEHPIEEGFLLRINNVAEYRELLIDGYKKTLALKLNEFCIVGFCSLSSFASLA